jgi:hypothetical protein
MSARVGNGQEFYDNQVASLQHRVKFATIFRKAELREAPNSSSRKAELHEAQTK